jgi:prepilin-type N-terminal cleavage/methylation domain-containing protein
MGRHFSAKRGFTLVEMSVVMGIIAVIVLIGITGLIGGRNNSIVNNAAEDLVTQVRDAQNRSTSIVTDSANPTTIPKGWAVHVNGSGYTLVAYTGSGANSLTIDAPQYSSSNNNLIGGVRYSVAVKNNSGYNTSFNDVFVSFMAPYGTPYLYATSNNGDDCSVNNFSICKWADSGKSSGEWSLSATNNNNILITRTSNADYSVYVTLSLNGATNTVIINSSGDVSMQ